MLKLEVMGSGMKPRIPRLKTSEWWSKKTNWRNS